MDTNQLVLKSVNSLFGYNYFIPSYQRGYRWTDIQVTQLLEDIWQFSKRDGKSKGEFYCLQPIVVKKCDNAFEVIDGQQRLTTLFLIIKYLEDIIKVAFQKFSCRPLEYKTRMDSRAFLDDAKSKTEAEAVLNIDYFHIWKAYATIRRWFENEENNINTIDFINTLLKFQIEEQDEIELDVANNVRVIWYEINETESNNSIDIFTRLNIGKIPLTNAELIKALFLQKGNFSEEKATLKQIQIASEWDIIEKTLQDDAFWFFIYNPDNPLKYDNRIEYIFDLMKDRTKESEDYHTFNEFSKAFQSKIKDDKLIDNIWLEIKKYFLTFEEWFKDYELFHYIGYLIDCGKDINKIKKESSNKTKMEFKDYLKGEIKKQIKGKIDDLDYSSSKEKNYIQKILLLFNIQTVLETQKSDMRFPFHKYKSEKWDIEHICSQTDPKFRLQGKADWTDDVLDYLKTADYTLSSDDIKGEVNSICEALSKMKTSGQYEDEKFDVIFKKVQNLFGEEDEQIDGKNDISNLALLDSTTNRSYGNSFFPIKRKRIIENDKNGIFIPIATKNVFLKYYSKKSSGFKNWNWSKYDAKDYLDAIKSTLKEFLSKENSNE